MNDDDEGQNTGWKGPINNFDKVTRDEMTTGDERGERTRRAPGGRRSLWPAVVDGKDAN